MPTTEPALWCPSERAWVRVLERSRLFGRELARVQVVGTDHVCTVVAASLCDQRPFNLDDFAAVAAGARVWRALSGDLLLAPLLAKVIPLPHQFRVLRKAMARFPVRMMLADEVGMGKTIEAGLILQELKLRGLVERVLVIAPKSLLLQWQAELRDLFGETLHLQRPSDQSGLGSDNLWQTHKQVITSLDAVKPKDRQRGWDQARLDRHNLARFHDLVEAGWDLVIIDEAHKVAGASTEVSRHQLAAELARVAPHVLLLSATPHSGKGDAFRRLLSLLDPEVFSGGVPLDRAIVEPYVLRTEKRSAVDAEGKALFAPRITRLVAVPWLPEHQRQLELYDAISTYAAEFHGLGKSHRRSNQLLVVLLQRLVASSTQAVKRYLHARLAHLRQELASEGGEQDLLLAPNSATATEPAPLADADDWDDDADLAIACALPGRKSEIAEIERLLALCGQAEAAAADARADYLLQLLTEQMSLDNEPAKKFLIFTEFTSTQAMLRDYLTTRGFAVVILHGGMDLDERKQAQLAFRADAQILVATDAGGEGLNLQFAHIVINYDLPWAPMRVEQRIGRVDRIGQPRPVRAFNLAGENSVEARLYDVWQNKLAAILHEYGVDKSGDVLDSTESEAQFQRLARTALLQPATFDHEVDRALSDLRKAAERSRDVRALFTSTVEREDQPPKVPLRAWMATMAAQRQPGLLEPVADDWAAIVRKLAVLRPYAPLDQPIPALAFTGLGFDVVGWWTIWRVGIAHGPWRQHQVFSLLHAESGAIHEPAAMRLWDAAASGTAQIRAAPDGRSAEPAVLRTQAEAVAERLFAQIVERTRRLADQRLAALDQSHIRRRQVAARIADPELRRTRDAQLARAHAAASAELRAVGEALPELDCLAAAWVVAQ